MLEAQARASPSPTRDPFVVDNAGDLRQLAARHRISVVNGHVLKSEYFPCGTGITQISARLVELENDEECDKCCDRVLCGENEEHATLRDLLCCAHLVSENIKVIALGSRAMIDSVPHYPYLFMMGTTVTIGLKRGNWYTEKGCHALVKQVLVRN